MAGELLLISGLDGNPMSGFWSSLTGSKTDSDKAKALVTRLDLLLKTNSDRLGDTKASAYSKLLNELNTRRKSAETSSAATKVVLSQLVQLVAAVNKDIGPTKAAREKGKVAMSGLSGALDFFNFFNKVRDREKAVKEITDNTRLIIRDYAQRFTPEQKKAFIEELNAYDNVRNTLVARYTNKGISEGPAIEQLNTMNYQARVLRDKVKVAGKLMAAPTQPVAQAPAAPSTSWTDMIAAATQGKPVADTQPAQDQAKTVQNNQPQAPNKKELPWYASPQIYVVAGTVAVGVAAMYFGYTLWHKKAAPKLEELLDE
jgi:hypothetical protein